MMQLPRALVVGGDAPTRTMLQFLLDDLGYPADTYPHVQSLADAPVADAALLVVVTNTPEDLHALADHSPPSGARPALLVLTHMPDQVMRRHAATRGAHAVVGLPAAPTALQNCFHAALTGGDVSAHPPVLPATVRAGGMTLRVADRVVFDAANWRAALSRREAAILAVLMSRPGTVVPTHDLLDVVWGADYINDGNMVAVYMHRLRAKFARSADRPIPLHTRHREGYLFETRHTPRSAGITTWAFPTTSPCSDDDRQVV